MQIGFGVLMFVVGSIFGSFLCCQVRRLEHYSKTKKRLGNRSICLNCHKKLSWYENIPVLSWLVQGGKCRKCKAKIGRAEIISEIGMGAALAGISSNIDITSAVPIEWVIFGITVVLTLVLGFLAIYDGLYGSLPTMFLLAALVLSVTIAIIKLTSGFSVDGLVDHIIAVGILGGLYFLLYLVSKGKWVGDGDWILGTAIALALGSPWLSLIVLFLSNTLACLVMYPSVKKKHTEIYFGPFMVAAFVIVTTFSSLLQNMVI